MADRRLVVNGDDFGLTPGVNAGIADAHRAGILTSASVLANAPATDDAVRIARAMPSLGIGFHLALVDADAVLPAELVPTLAPRGHFRPTWRAFIADAVRGRIASVEIERELEAQKWGEAAATLRQLKFLEKFGEEIAAAEERLES